MTISFKNEIFINRRGGPSMRPRVSTTFVVFLAASLITTTHAAVLGMSRRGSPNARKFSFFNRSGRRVDIFWINRSTNPVSFVTNSDRGEGYPFGGSTGVDSYIGHEFEIREMPSKKTGECKIPGNCQKAHFKVNDREGQKVTIDSDFNVKHEDDWTKAQGQADALLEECDVELREQNLDALQLVDAITDCMERKVNEIAERHEEERNFQAQLRQQMATELVPYACGDVNFTSSEAVINRTWKFEGDERHEKRNFQLQVFHEQVSSAIFQVPNFTTPEECDALTFFVERDSQIPFSAISDKTKQGRIVHGLANRFYKLTQASLGWDDLEPQAQYHKFGGNFLDIFKDTAGFDVLPACTNEDLESPGHAPSTCRLPGAARPKVPTRRFVVDDPRQVATVFLFCNQDESLQLGGLHFPSAAVHVDRQPNLLVVAQHQSVHEAGFDGYAGEYHFCPNYDVMTHTFLFDGHVQEKNDADGNMKASTIETKDEL